jgi:hypothetical protein
MNITELWSKLSGKKTYIVSIVAFVYGVGITAGWWQHSAALDIILGSLGAGALRSGLNATGKNDPAAPADKPVVAGGGVGMGNTDIGKTGAIILACLLGGSLYADDTNTIPPTVINHVAGALSGVASNNPNPILAMPANAGATVFEWLAANGQSGQGYAWSLALYSDAGKAKGKKDYQGGVLLTEGVNLTKHWQGTWQEFHIDLDAGQFLQGGHTRMQLGISPVLTLFSTPQLQTGKQATGMLNWLPVNLQKIQLSPYIGMDVTDLYNGNFGQKELVAGIEAKWNF